MMELREDNVRIVRRGEIKLISLKSLTAKPELRSGLLGTSLTIFSADQAEITLRGADSQSAAQFSTQVKEAWFRYQRAALENEKTRLDRLLVGIRSLLAPSQYPAACQIAPLLDYARVLDASLLSKLSAEAIGPSAVAQIAAVRQFVSNPRVARENGISAFVTAELERWGEFFDTIESRPLTSEQRLSVIVDEDATLVLAGAGSGKTSVITAKAAYLVRTGIRQPDEILLLAFAKNAAEEMSERVLARSGFPIAARTFHAIAYEIIGIVEGSKPALADHATDDLAFSNLLKQILRDLGSRCIDFRFAV
jgi:DNA helicase-4